MKKLYLLLILTFSLQLVAQKNKLINTKPLIADSFVGADQFDNIFYTLENTLYKNDAEKSYNDFQLGKLTSVDISNPFKIVLFYKDFNTVVLVDNNLNETDRVTFEFNASFVSKNIKNKLWVFNRDSNQLLIVDFKKNSIDHKTAPINFKPTELQSNLNEGFLLSENFIQTVDYLGNLTNKINIENTDSFRVYKKKIILLQDNSLHLVTPNNKTKLIYTGKEIIDFYFRNNDFYIFDGTNINHFRIDKKQ
jgi:hypothetical protein